MTDHHSHLRRLVESRSDDTHLDPMAHFQTLSGIRPTLPGLTEEDESVFDKPQWVKDFKAGWEASKKAKKEIPPKKAYNMARVSKKHGTYWIDGYAAWVDHKRGAHAQPGVRDAKKMGLTEDVEFTERTVLGDVATFLKRKDVDNLSAADEKHVAMMLGHMGKGELQQIIRAWDRPLHHRNPEKVFIVDTAKDVLSHKIHSEDVDDLDEGDPKMLSKLGKPVKVVKAGVMKLYVYRSKSPYSKYAVVVQGKGGKKELPGASGNTPEEAIEKTKAMLKKAGGKVEDVDDLSERAPRYAAGGKSLGYFLSGLDLVIENQKKYGRPTYVGSAVRKLTHDQAQWVVKRVPTAGWMEGPNPTEGKKAVYLDAHSRKMWDFRNELETQAYEEDVDDLGEAVPLNVAAKEANAIASGAAKLARMLGQGRAAQMSKSDYTKARKLVGEMLFTAARAMDALSMDVKPILHASKQAKGGMSEASIVRGASPMADLPGGGGAGMYASDLQGFARELGRHLGQAGADYQSKAANRARGALGSVLAALGVIMKNIGLEAASIGVRKSARGIFKKYGKMAGQSNWLEAMEDEDDLDEADKLGKPDVITGMKFGTRYKYNHGIFIDHVEDKREYHVSQAGRPSKKLGYAKTLAKAKEIALRKGDFMESADDLDERQKVEPGMGGETVPGSIKIHPGKWGDFGKRGPKTVTSKPVMTRQGSFKLSSQALKMFAKMGDTPDQALFKGQQKIMNAIPREKLPTVIGETDIAGAQDELARNPKGAIQKFMRNIHKVSPKAGKMLRAVPENAALYFYIYAMNVSGRDMADEILKRYLTTHQAFKPVKKEDVDDLDEAMGLVKGDKVRVTKGKMKGLKGVVTYVGSGPKGDKVSVRIDHPVHRMMGPALVDPKILVKEDVDDLDEAKERFELVYGSGGTGGPYWTEWAAMEQAEKLMKGSRSETWIAVVPARQTTDLAKAKPTAYLHRKKKGWTKGGGMTLKQIFKGHFREGVDPVADGNVLITDDVRRFRVLVGMDPLPRRLEG